MTTGTEESGRREHPDGASLDGPDNGAKDSADDSVKDSPDAGAKDGASGGDGAKTADGSRKRILLGAGIAVVVIGAIIAAAVTLGPSSSSVTGKAAVPEETTTAFLTAVQENDLPAAFAQLCAPLRTGTPEGVLKPGAVDPLAEAGGLKSFTVGEVTVSENEGESTAVSPYELVVGDDVARPGRAELVLEDGSWRICSFSV